MEETLASDPRIGTVLQERYRIHERLAAGGMGVVYRGERLELGRAVAIKFLHVWVAADPSFQQRFRIEAQALSQLSHPCCVSIIDFGMEGNAPFMVMDFVKGQTLGALVRERGPLPAKRALGITRQVLAGLAHAHAQGVIHRDIKPDNILLADAVGLGDQVRILDFGLARLRDTTAGLTQGMPVGTPSYMAPEQVRGEEVDARTDLYSVGVLLFELLTGKKPFDGERAAAVMLKHQEAPPPALGSMAPGAGFSQELEAVVGKALAKKPADRFASAADFSAALEALPELTAASGPVPVPAARVTGATAASPTPILPRPGEQRLSRFGKRPLVAAGAAGVLMLGLGAVWLWPGGQDEATASNPPASATQPPPSSSGKAQEEARTATVPPEALPGIEQIERWVKEGERRRDQSLNALARLRKQHPTSAYAPYLEGQVNFDNLRWVDGLASYGAAIRNNSAYRSDPTLIRDVIRCLVSDRFHAKCAEFLVREIGAPAAPFLEEAVRGDPYANVRSRAAALLPKVTARR